MRRCLHFDLPISPQAVAQVIVENFKLTGTWAKSRYTLYCTNIWFAALFSVKSSRFGQSESGKVKRPPGVKLAVIFVIWSIKLHWTTKVAEPRCHGWAGLRLKLTQRCGEGGVHNTTAGARSSPPRKVSPKKRTLTSSDSPFTAGGTVALRKGGSAPPNQQRPFAGVVFLVPLMGS